MTFKKLKDKEHSYYVADSYANYKPLTLRGTKQDMVETACKLNDEAFDKSKDYSLLSDFRGKRFCVLLADFK